MEINRGTAAANHTSINPEASAGDPGTASGRRLGRETVRTWVVWSLLVLSALGGESVNAQSFASRLNPTGDPIGGGPGYRAIAARGSAAFVVSNRAGLLNALGQARAGQVIYVEDTAQIDLSSVQDLVIPAGVTLASGRGQGNSEGALLFTNTMYPARPYVALFRTGGSNVRITGLRLRGPSAEVRDRSIADGSLVTDPNLTGVANLLRVELGNDNVEVDNCEIWAWDKWAIWLYYSRGARIHHNYIHHVQRSGYGYGIWVGGNTLESGSNVIIEANYFDYGRHYIGSSGHPISWEARYNVFGPHNSGHKLDRHSANPTTGLDTNVHHNWFIGGSGEDVAVRALPGGILTYSNNWTDHTTIARAVRLDAPGGLSNARFVARDNQFGGVPATSLPAARITASATTGTAPLTVQFSGAGSSDPGGLAIRQHHWSFGDGTDAIGATARGATAAYTFTQPGLYTVELTAFNAAGIPGTTRVPILVRPAAGTHVLSAWVQDSYDGTLAGYYSKQILMDGVVVWEDDVAGREGWQHVVVDVGHMVAGKTHVNLTFRLFARAALPNVHSQIVEVVMNIDDVHLFNGSVQNGALEALNGWYERSGSLSGQASAGWSRSFSLVGRSGRGALRISRNLYSPAPAGTWGEWYQPRVPVTAAPPPTGPVPTTHHLPLGGGWNLISLPVTPVDAQMATVLGGLAAVVFVEDALGQQYVPGRVENALTLWEIGKAYAVYTSGPTVLNVTGIPIGVAEHPIPLAAGWNYVPYYGPAGIAAEDAFAPLGADLALVRDGAGRTYGPGYGVDQIGDLVPGQGYKVFVRQATSLTYPAQ